MYLGGTATALAARGLDTNPPPVRTWLDDNPTLLVSWWATLFSMTIILFRLAGRWIRTERLFLEDRIMAVGIIPLMIRMAFAHLVLRNGTNNTVTAGLTAAEIVNREYGSRMVLAARVFYAMYLWTAKLTVTEFLHRLCATMWKRSWTMVLNAIRAFLALTFIGVVIATLSECQPFTHYWQVVPDPGPKCRQGYAQLLTMGIADIVTDLMLVAFPVYIVFQSNMKLLRKFSLSCLFGLSMILVGVTSYRLTGTLQRASSQPFRSLLASAEILVATFVANALVLGSFMRDKGVKKAKFNRSYGSMGNGNGNESVLDGPSGKPRPRGVQSWGSDTDLVGDVCIRVDDANDTKKPVRPAPVALPANASASRQDLDLEDPDNDDEMISPRDTTARDRGGRRRESVANEESDLKYESRFRSRPPAANAEPNPKRMSFFDVGGLLEDPPPIVVLKRPSGSGSIGGRRASAAARVSSGAQASNGALATGGTTAARTSNATGARRASLQAGAAGGSASDINSTTNSNNMLSPFRRRSSRQGRAGREGREGHEEEFALEELK